MSEHCLIKKNTPELRKKLEDAGLSVCICTTFEDADWLSCWGSHMSYDVHGVYPDDVDDLSKEAYLEMYLKETNPIICESDDAVYGCVQGGHAVAQWLLEHPKQDWNNNYLIYLYADLDKWKVRLDLVNKDYSSFYEPDLGNQLTAIALQDDGRMFKKLKLVRE